LLLIYEEIPVIGMQIFGEAAQKLFLICTIVHASLIIFVKQEAGNKQISIIEKLPAK
jgi:hypothetical protein